MNKLFRSVLVVLTLVSTHLYSANRFWVSVANSNWNNTANWSTTSGGAGGASVPGAADIAIFDGAAGSNGNCNLDAVLNVAGFQMNGGYNGTFVQGAFGMTIGASNAVFSGGTFNGGSSNITFNGNFTLSGTLFTSTTGFVEFFGGAYTFSSGTFAHNSGFARFKNTQTVAITGTQIFNEVDFQTSSGHAVFTITGTMRINAKMTTSNSNQCRFSGSGSIDLYGDLYLNNLYNGQSSHGGSFNLRIVGTGNQTIYGSTTIYRSSMPNTTINKSSGTLFLRDYITFENDYTYSAGTVDYTTFSNREIFAGTKNITISGTHNLGFVEFYTGFNHSVYTFAGALTVVNTISLSATTNQCRFSGSGSINLLGDIYCSNLYNGQSSHGGSFNLYVNGTGNQNLYGNATIYRSTLPNTIINKASGTVFYRDHLTFENDYTYTAGTVDYTSFTNKEIFTNSKNITITGTHILGDVEFYTGFNHSVYTFAGALTIATTMSMTASTNQCRFSGSGSINLVGDAWFNNLYNGQSSHGGSFNLYVNGTGNQNFNGNITLYRSTLPNTIINKASGTLFLKNFLTYEGDYTYQSGTVDYTTFTNKEIFTNTKNITITGTHSLGDVEFYTGFNHCVFTFAGALNIVTTMSMTASTNQCRFSGSGSINLLGDAWFNNLYNGQSSHGGSFNLNVNGTGNQNLNGNTTIYRSTIPNTVINKSSGTLFLKNYLTFEGDYTYQSGSVDYTSNTNKEIFVNTKNINITGTHNLGDVEFYTGFNHCVFTFVGALNIVTTMSMTSSTNQCRFSGSGSINLLGDAWFNNLYNGQSSHGGSFNLYVNGTGNQNFNGNSTIYRSTIPNTIINKSSGTLFLKNHLTFEGDYTYQAGTVDYTSFSNKEIFVNTKNINITGTHNLGNVEFYTGFNHCVFTFVGALNIVNTMSMTASTNQCRFSGAGSINLIGDAWLNNLYPGQGSHGTSFNLYVNGTGNQTINGNTTIYRSGLPNTTINKSSGTLTLKDYITFENNYTYSSGTLDYTSFANRIIFANTKAITIPATHNLGNIEFATLYGHCQFNINNTLIADNTMYFTGSNQCRFNTGALHAKGDITITNSYLGTANHANAVVLTVNGTVNQTFTGSGVIGTGRMPNIVINKASGSLFLSSVISVDGDWTYTQGIVDAFSNVSTVGFFQAKNLDAQGTSSIMKFYNVSLGDNARRTLTGNAIITNILSLGTGNIDLNTNKLSIYNSSTGAITNSTGYIKSENTGNLSKVSWMLGNTLGAHIIPFGTNAGSSIPFTFDLTAGTVDTVIVSTYPTNAANIPYPSAPNTVTNCGNNGNNSANTVDRFWQIDKTGASGTADLTFMATAGEVGTIANLKAEHWNTTINKWDPLLPAQTSYALGAKVPNVTNFSPWTLSGNNSPLPIELVSFEAVRCDEQACISWKTSSETNCDHYIIERSKDAVKFEAIEMVKAVGTSVIQLDYSVIDEQPHKGINYYRLKQTDVNGDFKYYNIKQVTFKELAEWIVYPNPSTAHFTIDGNNDAMLIYVYDVTGRLVFEKKFEACDGLCGRSFDIGILPNGTYNLSVVSGFDSKNFKLVKINVN